MFLWFFSPRAWSCACWACVTNKHCITIKLWWVEIACHSVYFAEWVVFFGNCFYCSLSRKFAPRNFDPTVSKTPDCGEFHERFYFGGTDTNALFSFSISSFVGCFFMSLFRRNDFNGSECFKNLVALQAWSTDLAAWKTPWLLVVSIVTDSVHFGSCARFFGGMVLRLSTENVCSEEFRSDFQKRHSSGRVSLIVHIC